MFSTLIQKFKKRVPTPKKYEPPFFTQPRTLWKFIAEGFFLLIFLSATLSGYLYIKISRNEVFQSGDTPEYAKNPIRYQELKRVLEEYGEKEKQFLELQANPPTIVDPSR